MPRWVIEIDRRIHHIAIAIERLRVSGTWNQRVRLDEMVNIRRNRAFSKRKKDVNVQVRRIKM